MQESMKVRFYVLCGAFAIMPAVGMLADPGSSRDSFQGQDGGQDLVWQSLAALEAPRFQAASAVHEGKLYVLGGSGPRLVATNRCDVYDPKTDTWTRLADMPQALSHTNAVVDGNVIWTAGGIETNGRGPVVDNVWKYDIEANSFEAGPPLPEKRAGGGLARVGRKLHYISGIEEDRNTDSEDHWTLDLDGGTEWVTAPGIFLPRNQFGVAVVGSKIYVIGGQFEHDATTSEPQDQPMVDVFDTESGTWGEGPDVPLPLSHFEPSTFVQGSDIIIVGGRSVDELSNQILAFSTESNEWRQLGTLPNALRAPVAQLIGGKLIVGSGAVEGYSLQEAVWSTPLEITPVGNPIAYGPASVNRGKQIFLRFCTECHDRDGKALTSAVADASDLTDPANWRHGTSDMEVFASIRDGRGDDMPPFGIDIRNEEDIWHIINFIRSIGPDKD